MHDVLIDSARRPFLDNAFEIQGSILYLDQGAAELASTTLGLPFIWGLGAVNICSLEAASYEDANRSFMLSTNEGLSSAHTISLTICITKLITESHPDILKAVNVHGQAVTKLVIFSSFSELAHACQASCSLGVEAFSEYSTLLRDAIKSIPSHNSLQINIRHLPMHICTMDASTLVLPSASAAATHARGSQGCVAGLTPPDETSGSSKYEGEGEGGDSGLTLLAHSLCGIIAQLGAKMETSPFYLGPCAKVLATELANLPLPEPVTSAGGG
ncbi:hypothetical protein CEUSTIGMA_g6755.t1 [Chlamydomonas eustigma]|uniref:Uncharacterized protein n=1 Tax=Chlamydomonas eustigma TaxID=1157962 RepID=A0A250X8A6_9CHLO|nr:hypothetical protein CEUSTIGMA_g6755.t1 [Chlamydomonas eustigma]|eukprot:GAX79314.1 hypothetical protein CEUSTIGMA_g6755.t1 [Chlamydomonas eustigma]